MPRPNLLERRDWFRALAPPALFIAFTLVAFHRLLPQLDSASTARYDTSMMVWNLWWVKHAIVHLQTNPLYTDYIYHPERVSLFFHTLTPLYGALTIPIQLAREGAAGSILSHNLVLMGTFAASGWFAYLLARELTGSMAGACAAGFVYGFSAYHFASTHMLNVASIQWLPLSLFCLVRFFEDGGRAWWFGLGGVFVAQLFTDYFYAIQMLLLCGAYGLWAPMQAEPELRTPLRRRGLVAGFAFVPGLAVLAALGLQVWSAGHWPDAPARGGAVFESADLSGFVIPGERHPFLGHWSRAMVDRSAQSEVDRDRLARVAARGDTMHLPIFAVVAAVTAFAFRDRRRKTWFWLGVFGLSVWLSLGPQPVIFGRAADWLPSLYEALATLPFVSMGKSPYRFAASALLGLSILSAFGVSGLRRSIADPVRRSALAWAFVAAMAIEGIRVLPTETLNITPVTRRLAERQAEGALSVADQSPYMRSEWAMLQQAEHQLPMDAGFIARVQPGIRHPHGARFAAVQSKLANPETAAAFRWVVCPRPGTPLADGIRDQAGLRRIYAWLERHALEREGVGFEVLYRLR